MRRTSRCSGAPGSSTISALPRCWRHSFPTSLRPSPSCWRTTTPRRGSPSRPFPTGSGQANTPATARPIWKPSATSPPGSQLLKTLPETPEHTQQALTLHIALGAALHDDQRASSARGGARLHPGTRVVSAGGRDATSWSQSCLGCGGFMLYGHSCTRHASSGIRCCVWRNTPTTPRSLSSPTMPSG